MSDDMPSELDGFDDFGIEIEDIKYFARRSYSTKRSFQMTSLTLHDLR